MIKAIYLIKQTRKENDMLKKAIVVFGIILLTGSLVSAQGIQGSEHDFSGQGWSGGEICVVCHTPHNANTTVNDAPLWNHEVTATSFTTYSTSTLDGAIGAPDGVSKLCLSCHDGTVAIDNFGATTNGSNFVTGSENLGTDLGDDHPISVTYDAAADGELHPTTTSVSGIGTIDDMLYSSKVECASCHDVHNSTNNTNLLVVDNSGSALCLTCHDK